MNLKEDVARERFPEAWEKRDKILSFKSHGYSAAEIAAKLEMSIHTVKYHLSGNVRKQNKAYNQKRRKVYKMAMIELSGGGCVNCGYSKHPCSLEFHHVDESTKNFAMSANGATPSDKKLWEEFHKVILLCRNCHCEVHQGDLSVDMTVQINIRENLNLDRDSVLLKWKAVL